MNPIPTEARATIAAYREGITEKQFLNAMWKRRDSEHPGRRKSRGKWPIQSREIDSTNVTPLRGKK